MIENNRLQVGIDVSKNRLDLALLRANGEPLESHHGFPNSLSGYERIKAYLLEVLSQHGFDGLDIAAEATSYYWLPAFIQMSQDPELSAYTPVLFLYNARWVRWHKLSLSPDNKDDFTDPQYIADRLRTRRPASANWQFDPKWTALRFYTRGRFQLVKSLTQEKNRFQLYLFLAYSSYAQQPPFSEILGATSRTLLEQTDLFASLAQQSEEELTAWLDDFSHHNLPDPLQNARRLLNCLQDSFPQHTTLVRPLQFMLNQFLTLIEDMERHIQQFDDHIANLVHNDYPEVAWLDSVPGLGPVLASGIAAEIAGLDRFANIHHWDKQRRIFRPRHLKEIEDAVAKFAGLWWPKNASGQFKAEEHPMSREGNAYLRYYLIEAGKYMRLYIPSYAAYYQKKYRETSIHKHKRAAVLTGRKALGLFVGLLHHQEYYRGEEANLTLS